MKAVAYAQNLPIEHPESLLDVHLPDPVLGAHDLLVEVKAISVNPVDVKVRAHMAPEPGQPRVLGWDAAGVVRAVGSQVSLFQVGDRVWYAGALQRPGANSELHAVDERIVGHMPKSLDFDTAAALPLTAITAWELLFDRLQVLANHRPSGQKLLVVGAAGGVGSILVQLARRLTGLTIIGTASRPTTQAWVEKMGAHHVIDHRQPLSQELQRLGIDQVDYVASLTHTEQHFPEIVASLAPQGKLALIDDPAALDIRLLKPKSISLHWEFMYTRSMFATDDQIRQHQLLNELARLVDAGLVKSTVTERLGTVNAAHLKQAHGLLERHAVMGKIVLAGF